MDWVAAEAREEVTLEICEASEPVPLTLETRAEAEERTEEALARALLTTPELPEATAELRREAAEETALVGLAAPPAEAAA